MLVSVAILGALGAGAIAGVALGATGLPFSRPSSPAATVSPGAKAGGRGHAKIAGAGLGAQLLAAAAKALGITPAELRADLRSGQSIAAVAKARGIDVSTVITALTDQVDARIDAAVKAGKLTAAQGAKMKTAAATRIEALVNRAGVGVAGPGGVTGTLRPAAGLAPSLNDAAQALGITRQQLMADLKAGQSIAAIAQARGVDLNTVITALTNGVDSRIDAAVSAGKLTADQGSKLKAAVGARISAFVHSNRPKLPPIKLPRPQKTA